MLQSRAPQQVRPRRARAPRPCVSIALVHPRHTYADRACSDRSRGDSARLSSTLLNVKRPVEQTAAQLRSELATSVRAPDGGASPPARLAISRLSRGTSCATRARMKMTTNAAVDDAAAMGRWFACAWLIALAGCFSD